MGFGLINEDKNWEEFKNGMIELGISVEYEDGSIKNLNEILEELAKQWWKEEINLDSNE